MPEFYARILGLTKMTRMGLKRMDLLDDTEESRLTKMEGLIDKLLQLSIKELQDETISAEDALFSGSNLFASFGDTLRDLLGGIFLSDIRPEDQYPAIIADVHTDQGSNRVLEEGVGYWSLLLAACPVPGDSDRLFLAAGPVFSNYEFTQPVTARLTDEKWKELLDSEDAPASPAWTYSFVINSGGHDRRAELPYSLKTTSQDQTGAGTEAGTETGTDFASSPVYFLFPWTGYPFTFGYPLYSGYFSFYPGYSYFDNRYNFFTGESCSLTSELLTP